MSLEILVVDDDDAQPICDYIHKKFENNNLHFDAVVSGDAAIAKIKEKNYDLVILDYNMPRKNGYFTAHELRSLRPDLKIIGFSSAWLGYQAEEVGLVLYSASIDPIINYISEFLKLQH